MEWVDPDFDDDEPTDMLIADIGLRGVVTVRESGPGFTEEYKAERLRESGGAEEVDEPEPTELEVESLIEEETWQALNALRRRHDPFPVAVGPFVFELMGIESIEKDVDGEFPGAIRVTIILKEFREIIVQRQSLGEVLGGGQADGMGGASGAVQIAEGWIDDGTGHDVRTGQPIPQTRTISVPNGASPTYTIGSGESFGRVLFNVAGPNGAPLVAGQGSGWAIQDVGLSGPSHNMNRAFIGPNTQGGGGRVDHIWMGDGTPHPRGTGMWWNNSSNGNLHVSTSYGAHWRDNWVYGSAPRGPHILIEDCYGYQNEVATYRLNRGEIRNCVANHDASHSGRGDRCVWVWAPGPAVIVDSHLRSTGYTIITHDGNPRATMHRGGNSGRTQGNVSMTGVGSANMASPHPQIPGSAIDAARGYAPGVGGGGQTPTQ